MVGCKCGAPQGIVPFKTGAQMRMIGTWSDRFSQNLLPLFHYLHVPGTQIDLIFHAYTCSVTQSWLTLCDPIDDSPPGSFVHGIFQSGLPFPSPGDLPHPGIKPASLMPPALAGGFFTTNATAA